MRERRLPGPPFRFLQKAWLGRRKRPGVSGREGCALCPAAALRAGARAITRANRAAAICPPAPAQARPRLRAKQGPPVPPFGLKEMA